MGDLAKRCSGAMHHTAIRKLSANNGFIRTAIFDRVTSMLFQERLRAGSQESEPAAVPKTRTAAFA